MEVDPAVSALDPRTQFTVGGTEGLLALWISAGLQNVSVDDLSMPTVFRDFDDYWQPCLLDGTTPIPKYARSLDAKKQAVLRGAPAGRVANGGRRLDCTGRTPGSRPRDDLGR